MASNLKTNSNHNEYGDVSPGRARLLQQSRPHSQSLGFDDGPKFHPVISSIVEEESDNDEDKEATPAKTSKRSNFNNDFSMSSN